MENPPKQEFIRYEGINAQGFGTIARRVMRDRELSIEAKGIYAYFCSLAGGGESSFPQLHTILEELDISKPRYLRHRKTLIERGYIRIEREYTYDNGAPVPHNTYVIVSEVAINEAKEDIPRYAAQPPTNPADLKQVLGFNKKQEYVSYPQTPGQSVGSQIVTSHESEKTSYPQTPGQSVGSQIVSVHKSLPPIIENNINNNSIQLDTIQPTYNEELASEYKQLTSTAVNKNRLSDGLTVFCELREKYAFDVIEQAWLAEQKRCEGREERYYTQLYRWLNTHAESDCEKILAQTNVQGKKTRIKAIRSLLKEDAGFKELIEQDDAFQKRLEENDVFTEEEIREGQERLETIYKMIDEYLPIYIEKQQVK